ncbi:hypothetical protein OBBRIDRAFT_839436 [Obba rivulosa]|uniref:Uncharacterized protein n=1 Tax=Obba rivulosa TaxID=1052685 RepID=A0A8E2AQC9_9APHY|nr:hypothetical protein OBBRIDRAFT_839436 [Obba rivulosa]
MHGGVLNGILRKDLYTLEFIAAAYDTTDDHIFVFDPKVQLAQHRKHSGDTAGPLWTCHMELTWDWPLKVAFPYGWVELWIRDVIRKTPDWECVQRLITLQGWYRQIERNVLDAKSKDSESDCDPNADLPEWF